MQLIEFTSDVRPAGHFNNAVADNGHPVPLAGPSVAAIDRGARRAGEIAGGAPAALNNARHDAGGAQSRADDPPRLHGTRAKDISLWPIGRDAAAGRRRRDIRIAGEITVFVHHFLKVIAVGADEAVSPIIERQAVLGAAADGGD